MRGNLFSFSFLVNELKCIPSLKAERITPHCSSVQIHWLNIGGDTAVKFDYPATFTCGTANQIAGDCRRKSSFTSQFLEPPHSPPGTFSPSMFSPWTFAPPRIFRPEDNSPHGHGQPTLSRITYQIVLGISLFLRGSAGLF